MAKEKRFEKVYSQGLGEVKIMVDRITGVNYVFIGGGVTPLLDSEGKVVITPVHKDWKGPEF